LLHKSHILWESYISMFYLLATDLLDLCVIVISFIMDAFVCTFVTWIKDYLLTYLPSLDGIEWIILSTVFFTSARLPFPFLATVYLPLHSLQSNPVASQLYARGPELLRAPSNCNQIFPDLLTPLCCRSLWTVLCLSVRCCFSIVAVSFLFSSLCRLFLSCVWLSH